MTTKHKWSKPQGAWNRCERCGALVNLDVNVGRAPKECVPTPQWLRDNPEDEYYRDRQSGSHMHH